MSWAKVNITEGKELWAGVLYEIPLLKPKGMKNLKQTGNIL